MDYLKDSIYLSLATNSNGDIFLGGLNVSILGISFFVQLIMEKIGHKSIAGLTEVHLSIQL